MSHRQYSMQSTDIEKLDATFCPSLIPKMKATGRAFSIPTRLQNFSM